MIMSKFLPQKKKLLEDVYEKASNEAIETSFNGILLHLEQILKDEHESLSYKTFENYYKTIVEKEEDYNIKKSILDNLCQYLGYDTFKDYCSEWKTIEYTIQHTISKIVITIINKPVFTMPEFMKQNGFGIVELTFVGLLLTGSFVFSNSKRKLQKQENLSVFSFFGNTEPVKEKKCMYWDKFEYKLADCEDDRPYLDLQPVNFKLLKYFKKIKRKDTLTVDNALGKTWYSKYNGNVEFFTMDGVDPDTGKELDQSSSRMILKYAGVQEE